MYNESQPHENKRWAFFNLFMNFVLFSGFDLKKYVTKPNTVVNKRNPADADWDYVIAGAGTSGCALAAQLAKAGKRVLLLERGPDNDVSQCPRPTLHYM